MWRLRSEDPHLSATRVHKWLPRDRRHGWEISKLAPVKRAGTPQPVRSQDSDK